MEEIKSNLTNQLLAALKKLGVENIEPKLTLSQNLAHGDYTTNVAFQVSKILKKNSMDAASEIIQNLDQTIFKVSSAVNEDKILVEKAIPGFINFTLSKNNLVSKLHQLLTQGEKIGTSTQMENTKVVVEFTDPNPFKEFHIGHVYTNTVGESISRILESQGAIVWRADYFGDVGMHVAKAIWGIVHTDINQTDKKEPVYQENLDKLIAYAYEVLEFLKGKTLNERIHFMGKAYALGSTAYEESDRAKEDIKHLNKLIYIAAQRMWEKEKNLTPQVDYQKQEQLNEKEMDMVYSLYTTGRAWSLEYFESIYTRLGMHFDGYYPESIAGEKGYKLVKEHIKDEIFEEHDGAVVFRGEKENLHTRVFINSLGLPTYEAKELGLAPWKYEDFTYNKSIIVTGNEITEYFKVLIAAMKAVEPELGNITTHLPHGMVRLPEGKMSSRTGKIIIGEWLIDEAVKKAGEMGKHSVEIEGSQVTTTSHKVGKAAARNVMPGADALVNVPEQIGIGAIKYAFLKSGIGKDIEFDLETSLSLTGNSGPYLQYTYVRTQSILQKAEKNGISGNYPLDYTPGKEESNLLRMLVQYQSVVSSAAEGLSPSTICTYLFELAKQFNLFYQTERIVDASLEQDRQFRIALTQVVGQVLQSGLALLGIVAPKRM